MPFPERGMAGAGLSEMGVDPPPGLVTGSLLNWPTQISSMSYRHLNLFKMPSFCEVIFSHQIPPHGSSPRSSRCLGWKIS